MHLSVVRRTSLTPQEMAHSARPAAHPSPDSASSSGNTEAILEKVKRTCTPCSHSPNLVLLQPSRLFCELEGASLPRSFYPSVSGFLVYCSSKRSLNLLPISQQALSARQSSIFTCFKPISVLPKYFLFLVLQDPPPELFNQL